MQEPPIGSARQIDHFLTIADEDPAAHEHLAFLRIKLQLPDFTQFLLKLIQFFPQHLLMSGAFAAISLDLAEFGLLLHLFFPKCPLVCGKVHFGQDQLHLTAISLKQLPVISLILCIKTASCRCMIDDPHEIRQFLWPGLRELDLISLRPADRPARLCVKALKQCLFIFISEIEHRHPAALISHVIASGKALMRKSA